MNTRELIEQNLQHAAGAWRHWWRNGQIEDKAMLSHIVQRIVNNAISLVYIKNKIGKV